MAKLKPCPFCGSVARYVTTRIPDGQCSYPVGYVECQVCGARTGMYNIESYYGITPYKKEEICKRWNKRYTPSSEIEFDYEAEDCE